jgi:Transposase DDE domain group 1
VWRTLDEATPVALARVERARAKVWRHVWGLLPLLPASLVAGADLGEVVVLDVDATLVTAHSEKERARATFKGGFGFHPIGVWCDNTTELLAISLRPGNAGSNHAGDHIDVLTRAIAQVPTAYRRRLLVRADGAGATHELLDWLTGSAQVRGRRLEYSVGFPTKNTALTSAITTNPERVWTPAITTDGEIRDGADVAEVTGLLDLRRRPAGMRVIVRRERPHPGAQCRCWRRLTVGATKPSPPTPGSGSWRSWQPGTRPTPESRTGSRPPKTPVWAGSHHGSTPSIRPGCR